MNNTDGFLAFELDRRPLNILTIGQCKDVWPNAELIIDDIKDRQLAHYVFAKYLSSSSAQMEPYQQFKI